MTKNSISTVASNKLVKSNNNYYNKSYIYALFTAFKIELINKNIYILMILDVFENHILNLLL